MNNAIKNNSTSLSASICDESKLSSKTIEETLSFPKLPIPKNGHPKVNALSRDVTEHN